MDAPLEQLRAADLTVEGRVANASNATVLVGVGDPASHMYGIYKPRVGERPLWDFPQGTLCQREVAAYEVSEYLGWAIVPPTVLRDGPFGEGSVQLFVPHDPAEHYFVLVDEPSLHDQLARMAVFDLVVNNADRKGSHVLRGEDGRLRGIDHGLTFHPAAKLRTVIWDLGGTPLQPAWRADLARLRDALATGDAFADRLCDLLSAQEVRLLARRADLVCAAEALPDVDPDRRPYPWPLL